jgi:hypothetical protein
LLTCVDLTIGGRAYSLAEVGFAPGVIGGVVNGVDTLASSTNDFFLSWNPASSTPLGFDHVTTGSPSLAASADFSQFSVTAATAAPEPSTWATMLIGFGDLGFLTYRSSRTAASIAT